MSTVVRFLQFLTLGTWVGSILYFGAIVAPAAFIVLTQDQAGALVGLTLGRLHLLGIVAGVDLPAGDGDMGALGGGAAASGAAAGDRHAGADVCVAVLGDEHDGRAASANGFGGRGAAHGRAARFVRPAASHLGESGDGRARRRAAGALLHQPRPQGHSLKCRRPVGTATPSPTTLCALIFPRQETVLRFDASAYICTQFDKYAVNIR